MRRLAVILPLLLLTNPAAADDPSFNCEKASTPAEYLICGDSELVRLDALLGETWGKVRGAASEAQKKAMLVEQRDWLKSRLERCGMPSKGSEPEEQQAWDWAPCLAERYRERLAALGVTDPAPTAAPAGIIHPLCVMQATGSPMGEGDGKPTSLSACSRAYRHIPVEKNDDGSYASVFGGFFRQSFGYLPSGTLPDGSTVILVQSWGGGTGQFSSVYQIKRKGDVLTGGFLAGGGDRCNSGVVSVELLGGKTLRLVQNTTPSEFVSVAAPELVDTAAGDLPSCAICCYGTVTIDYTVGGDAGTLVSAKLEDPEIEDEPSLVCLNKVVGLKKGKTLEIAAEQATAAARRFGKDCRRK